VKKMLLRIALSLALVAILAAIMTVPVFAGFIDFPELDPLFPGEQSVPGGPGSNDPNINITINGEGSDVVRIVVLFTVLSVLPSVLLMMTSFTRIIIVFSMLRNAMGTQQTPPNQVLVGLALALTLFIMNPVITAVYENAYRPYADGTITTEQFLQEASDPLRDFMLRQTRVDDIDLFQGLSGEPMPTNPEDFSMAVVIPAFITSEIRAAFTIAFLVYIPFLVIDMVVASSLMSMGMMMLPPIMISLPFKIMLFVLVDGWALLIRTLVATYNF